MFELDLAGLDVTKVLNRCVNYGDFCVKTLFKFSPPKLIIGDISMAYNECYEMVIEFMNGDFIIYSEYKGSITSNNKKMLIGICK